MIKRITTILLVACGLVGAAGPAEAQMLQWTDRAFVNINGGYQSRAETSVTVTATETVYDEQASYTASQTVKSSGGFFDISGGVRVWGNLAIGLGYTQVSTSGSAEESVTEPHPLFYNTPRTASATMSGLRHREQQVHLFAMFVIPMTDKFEIAVSGGPTFFSLKQGTIGTFEWAEGGPPYSSISVTLTATEVRKSKTGVNIGGDVTYKITKNLGIGGFVRYAGTSVSVTTAGGATFDENVGGVQVGAGARIRF